MEQPRDNIRSDPTFSVSLLSTNTVQYSTVREYNNKIPFRNVHCRAHKILSPTDTLRLFKQVYILRSRSLSLKCLNPHIFYYYYYYYYSYLLRGTTALTGSSRR
jgi:hypothetical protein